MTKPPDHQPQHDDNHRPEGVEIDRAALIRAAADGETWANKEITAQPQPADNAQLAFERSLRQRVAHAMDQHTPPAGLRDSVADMLRTAPSEATHDDHHHQDAPAALEFKPGDAAHETQSGSPIIARLGGWLALAAVLTLSTAVIFQSLQSSPGGSSSPSQSVVREIASYAINAGGSTAGLRPVESAEDAQRKVDDAIGACPMWFADRVQALEANGYKHAGVADCSMPGYSGDSIKLRFTPLNAGDQPISVFIKRLPADEPLTEDSCFMCVKSHQAGRPVIFWRDGDYVVVVQANSDEAANLARQAFRSPTTLQTI